MKEIKNTEVKKVSLEQLINKKLEKDGKKEATKEIYIESLDGFITFKNPSDSQLIEFSDRRKNGSYTDMMTAYERLIYDCCPMLHSKELQESIEINYPYDAVRAIFDLKEISKIGLQLLNFFDNEDGEDNEDSEEVADEKLKNS